MPTPYVSPYSKSPLTSLGLKTSIAMETTAGTRPETGYYLIPNVTGLPDLDFENDTIDVTSYDNTKNRSYLPGLKDTGGLLSLETNFNEYDVTMWDDIAKKVKEDTTGKIAWLMVDILGTKLKYFIPVIPTETGIPEAPVNDKVSQNLNFTVAGDVVRVELSSTTAYYSGSDYEITVASQSAQI